MYIITVYDSEAEQNIAIVVDTKDELTEKIKEILKDSHIEEWQILAFEVAGTLFLGDILDD